MYIKNKLRILHLKLYMFIEAQDISFKITTNT